MMLLVLWPLYWLGAALQAFHRSTGGKEDQSTFEHFTEVTRPNLLAAFTPLVLEVQSGHECKEEFCFRTPVGIQSPALGVCELDPSSGPCTEGSSTNASGSASCSDLECGPASGTAASGAASSEEPTIDSSGGAAVAPSLGGTLCNTLPPGDSSAPCSSAAARAHQHQHQKHVERECVSTASSSDSRPDGCGVPPLHRWCCYETDEEEEEEEEEEVCMTITELLRMKPDAELLAAWRHDGMAALGSGGFGAVYRGHLTLLDGRVLEAAAKLYSAAGGLGRSHMRREARALRLLQESGAAGRGCVLRLYGSGAHPGDGRPMLLTELGSSCLHQGLVAAETRRAAAGCTSADAALLPEAEVLEVLTAVAGALTDMHAVGLVHQDIKPENVLYRPNGSAFVADLGLAVLLRRGRTTYRGGAGGTSWFAAPELGQHLPALSDWIRLRRSLEEQQAAAGAAAPAAPGSEAAVMGAEAEAPPRACSLGAQRMMAPHRPLQAVEPDTWEESEGESEEESGEGSDGMDFGSSLEGSGASEFQSSSCSDSDSDSYAADGSGSQEQSRGQQHQHHHHHHHQQQQQQQRPWQGRRRGSQPAALTPAVDVWSLGMLALCLAVTGNAVQGGAFAVLRWAELPGYVPAWAASLIRDCTAWEPSARPSAGQVLARLQAVAAAGGLGAA
ncbi:hypothetical protein HYH02_014679 [Chlamydomonas schloesseri]|uniref:Protein kinase domain-containing protein n=1 Tax=Chlamydomonas schloesseri TaxID=2026947 RepID=A0A835VV58_9CHLO|nr:hypothetical protein HYH02_014679 [Chlamydomonas schloesseri]|eukprot:KAG2427033.1 hypothetical protein HYH02_014679 [Chlamydomonas schloesseri]